jgi:DNA-binding CsgD family transcriptional regulator
MKHIDIMVTNAEGVIRSITTASAKVLGFESEELVGQNFFALLEGRKDTDRIARLFDEAGEAELMLAIAKEYGYSVLDEWMVDEESNVLPCAIYVYNKRKEGEYVWVVIPRRGPLDGAPMTLDLQTRNLILDLRQRGGKVIALSYRDIAIFDSFMSGQTDAEIAEDLRITKGAVRYSLRRMVDASAANSRKEMRRNFWYSISELALPDARSYIRGEHGFYTQHKHIDDS